MKQSLRQAISLFSFSEQIQIYIALFCFKMKQKAPAKTAALLQNCNDYVRLIEQGVSFANSDDSLIKASLIINEQQVSVFLRKNSSDLQVLESVVLQEEYKIVTANRKKCNSIVDAGGNIGLTTVYLHAFFPEATFMIIEPDDKNFALLKKNLEQNRISKIKLFNNALWVSNEKLVISNSFRDGKDWSLTVEKANSTEEQKGIDFLEGISLQEICTTTGIETIDLLKIDIEGAERFLFNDRSFLQHISNAVSLLVIEIHDEFNIRETINHEMTNAGFTAVESGDVTLFSKT